MKCFQLTFLLEKVFKVGQSIGSPVNPQLLQQRELEALLQQVDSNRVEERLYGVFLLIHRQIIYDPLILYLSFWYAFE